MYTAAQPGLDVTQRRVSVSRRATSCPGWSRPQPTSAYQTHEPWRVISPVITSPAVPPPIPAVDSCLGNGAAVLSQRCIGSGIALGDSVFAWARGQTPVTLLFCLLPTVAQQFCQISFPAGGAVSRRGRAGIGRAQCSVPHSSFLDHPFCPSPARLSAAWTTSTAVPRATLAWLRGSVRGGTRWWLDWRRCLPAGLPCPNPEIWAVTSTPAAQWGRPAAQA